MTLGELILLLKETSFSFVMQILILSFLNLLNILLLLSENELICECKVSDELVFLIFEGLVCLDLGILLNSVFNWLPSWADHWIVIRQNTIWHTPKRVALRGIHSWVILWIIFRIEACARLCWWRWLWLQSVFLLKMFSPYMLETCL